MAGTKANKRQSKGKATNDDTSPAAKTVWQIIERAVKAGASDVHIEPRAGYGVVRQRIDGILQVTTKLPGKSFGVVVAGLKNLAGLNIAQKLAPQAGHYNISVGQRSYEVHIATLPVLDGERVTLHFTDLALTPVSLQELGYWGSALESINRALSQPHGLIVINSTDQTSTLLTLGSMLHILSNPCLNLASVEQNVLYRLPHVNQTVVKKEIGMTFARRLKQILGHEPNVVMVSEVLDKSTAKTIVKAAESRQLVLAGLHASSTAGALVGLVHLSGEPTMVASAMQVAISQKIVAKLCRHCREAYSPNSELTARIARIFGTNNDARMLRLHKLEVEALAEQLGVCDDQPLSSQPSTTEQYVIRLWRPHPGGCKTCNHTGYNGRLTINEIIPHSNALQTSLHESVGINELRKVARIGGMIPLAQDALIKALRGLVPIEIALANTTR